MPASDLATPPARRSAPFTWSGIALLAGALLAHVLAAIAIGGSFRAYRDHLLGFAGATLITGAIIAVAGAWFWRGRSDISLFTLGVLQALLGLYVWVTRFSVHG